MKVCLKGVSIVFMLLSSGCGFAANSTLKEECASLVTSYFWLPLKKQLAEFGSYDLETQYKLLICGNQVIHPPAIYLAGPLAREGMGAVPFLKKKLALANGDLTVRDIVLVFAEMQRQRTYDVASDLGLIQLLTKSIEQMRDNDWKLMARQKLEEILGSPSTY